MPITDRYYGVSGGVAIKLPCRVVATSAINLYGLQTVDGVVVVEGDRVLVTGQVNALANGIYIAAAGDWVRAPDFNGALDVVGGTFVHVTSGQSNPDSYWRVAGEGAFTVGSDQIIIISSSGDITFRDNLATSVGGTLVGLIQSGVGAVVKTLQTWFRYAVDVNVFDFLTADEIAAVQAYSFTTDVTAKVQAAMDHAFSTRRNLFVPAGGYLVTGLKIPGTTSNYGWSFRMYGQGCGNPFAFTDSASTYFKSVTNAPVLTDNAVIAPQSNSSYEIDNIRFVGNSTTPVVLLNALYGVSSFHHNAIYQGGVGDGFKLLYGATTSVHDNYSINKDYVTNGLGAARVGVAFHYASDYGAGLVNFRKNTARGFKDGLILDGASGDIYSASIEQCECSTVYNGITIGPDADVALIDSNYFEGMDGGTAILNKSPFAIITNNLIFSGFAVGIDDTDSATQGTLIQGNTVANASRANTTCIKVASTGSFGGPGKSIKGNTILFSGSGGSIAGVVGLEISGTWPRVEYTGNNFNPRGPWVGGAGTTKILDNSQGGFAALWGQQGMGIVENGQREFPHLGAGVVSYGIPDAEITTAPDGVISLGRTSWVVLNLDTPANVTTFSKMNQGQIVHIYCANGNPSFINASFLKLAGGANYTPPAGGAIITFICLGASGGSPVCRQLYPAVEF